MTNVKFNQANCRPNRRGANRRPIVSGINFGASPLNSLIDDFINGDLFGPDFKKTTKSVINNLSGYPAVNIKETEAAFHLELAVPGFEKDAFEIAIEAEQLVIRTKTEKIDVSEAKNEAESETKETKDAEVTTEEAAAPKVKFLRREFTAKNFNKSFTLPENIDTEAISANYESGILTVALPKKEVEVKAVRTIAVG